LTEKEILETPITVHGKIQRYQVNVEARFDEDEDAIEILTKSTPVQEKKKWRRVQKNGGSSGSDLTGPLFGFHVMGHYSALLFGTGLEKALLTGEGEHGEG
jgi:hypothetical protein